MDDPRAWATARIPSTSRPSFHDLIDRNHARPCAGRSASKRLSVQELHHEVERAVLVTPLSKTAHDAWMTGVFATSRSRSKRLRGLVAREPEWTILRATIRSIGHAARDIERRNGAACDQRINAPLAFDDLSDALAEALLA